MMKGVSTQVLVTALIAIVVLRKCDAAATHEREFSGGDAAQRDDLDELGNDHPVALSGDNERDDRFLIALVKISPDACTTTDATSTTGTCMPSKDCTSAGGTSSGTCANGLGVCCLVTKRCTTSTSLNNTYFANPTDTTTTGSCTLTVNRMNSNICQLRLDFVRFSLSQPSSQGICDNEFFAVQSGVSQKAPSVCGDNAGQHMYVNVDPNGGVIKLAVTRSGPISLSQWNIKIAQIECTSKYRAPSGCLQYYTETSGTVSSFNYGTAPTGTTAYSRQISNMAYSVCINRADGFCNIVWQRNATTNFSFTVTDALDAVDPVLIGTVDVSGRGENCTTDYVVIPGGVTGSTSSTAAAMIQADRYCGLGFPDTVTSSLAPFAIYVNNDADEAVDNQNLGFQLTYLQTTC